MKTLFRVLCVLCVLCGCLRAATTNIVTTITITNAANINGTNGARLIVTNADSTLSIRTWTNSVFNTTTQILAGTTIAQDAQALLIQVAANPFANLRVDGNALTYIRLQGSTNYGVTIISNWATLSYSTQILGSAAQVVSTPLDNQPNAVSVASQLVENLYRLSTNGIFAGNLSGVTAIEGANTNVDPGSFNAFIRITGPTNDFQVLGFSGGKSARLLGVLNATTNRFFITNNSPMAPTNSRILTIDGGVETIGTNGWALFVYDAVTNRWVMLPKGIQQITSANSTYVPLLSASNQPVVKTVSASSDIIQPTDQATNVQFNSGRLLSKMDCSIVTNQIDIASGPQSMIWTNMSTNCVLQCTNVWTSDVTNRTIDILFLNGSATNQYVTVNCPNPAGVTFHWLACPTNGLTSFTVTNGGAASLCITFFRTNHAETLFTAGQ